MLVVSIKTFDVVSRSFFVVVGKSFVDVCNLVVCSILLVDVTVVLAFVDGDNVVDDTLSFVVLSTLQSETEHENGTKWINLIRKVCFNLKFDISWEIRWIKNVGHLSSLRTDYKWKGI